MENFCTPCRQLCHLIFIFAPVTMRAFAIILSLLSCVLAHSNDNTRLFTVVDGLPTNQIRQIVGLPNHQMLVVTECGTCLFNGKEFVEQQCNLDSIMQLPHFGGYGYLWQGDSLLWLKDFYSAYIYDTRTRSFKYDYNAVQTDESVARFITEKGDSMIHAIIEHNDPLRHHFDSLTAGTPLQGAWLQTVCRDHQGGLWMGTQTQGILYERPPHPMATVTPLPDDTPLKVAEATEGKLIIGALHGVYLYDCASRTVERTLTQGEASCLSIDTDSKGRIWISTTQGLYCYDHGSTQLFDGHNTAGLLHSKIRWQGVKMHWKAHREWYYNRKLLHNALEVARWLEVPVLFHTGNFKECKACVFMDICKQYDDLTFVLAHGRPLDEAKNVLEECANVYVDTAFMPADHVKELADAGYSNRILYGTDVPINLLYNKDVSIANYIRNCC